MILYSRVYFSVTTDHELSEFCRELRSCLNHDMDTQFSIYDETEYDDENGVITGFVMVNVECYSKADYETAKSTINDTAESFGASKVTFHR